MSGIGLPMDRTETHRFETPFCFTHEDSLPRTSVLGGILLTGYLGGAVASQLRVGHSFMR